MKILLVVNNPSDYIKFRDYFENKGHIVKMTHNLNSYRDSIDYDPIDSFDEILAERNTANYSFSEIQNKWPQAQCIDHIGSLRKYIENKYPTTPLIKEEPETIQDKVVSQSKGAQYSNSLRHPKRVKNTHTITPQNFWKGNSKPYQTLYSRISKFSSLVDTFLLVGESGTGKEHLALEIHNNSGVSGKFVSVDCGALTDELLASALFGHVKGSFTGAYEGKTGYIEEASEGTLFLDEIENLSFKGQISLLRVLQEKYYNKVGSTQNLPMSCKLICSTNMDLEDLVKRKLFRLDLYYRINQITLNVPALKDIPKDVPELIDFLIKEISNKYNIRFYDIAQIKKQAIKELYPYPGNIRQLKQWLIQKAFEYSDIPCNLHGIELMRSGRLY